VILALRGQGVMRAKRVERAVPSNSTIVGLEVERVGRSVRQIPIARRLRDHGSVPHSQDLSDQ